MAPRPSLPLLTARIGPKPRRADFADITTEELASLMFRFAWVYAGRASARDDAAVAAMGRDRRAPHDDHQPGWQQRALSVRRSPLPLPETARRAYGEAVRRTSLAIERRLRR